MLSIIKLISIYTGSPYMQLISRFLSFRSLDQLSLPISYLFIDFLSFNYKIYMYIFWLIDFHSFTSMNKILERYHQFRYSSQENVVENETQVVKHNYLTTIWFNCSIYLLVNWVRCIDSSCINLLHARLLSKNINCEYYL